MTDDERKGLTVDVTYRTCDGVRETKCFKTIAGARTFAQKWIGETPEIGSRYAVSGDGIGTISVAGATLFDLFPKVERWTA